MTVKTLIKGGGLVLPEGVKNADLLIEGRLIAAIGQELNVDGARLVDASGCLVFPGFIDAHTHLDMHNGVTRTADDFRSGSASALAGGTTTIIDFATQTRGKTLTGGFDEWSEKARGRCMCDYGFHMAVTGMSDEIAEEISELADRGVTSFKAYMAYDALRMSDSDIFRLVERVAGIGGLVCCHCENGDLITGLAKRYLAGRKTSPEYHPLSRPDYLEAEAVTRFCAIGRAAGAAVYVVHLSTRAGLEAAQRARTRGQRVLLETCPQYLTLDESLYRLPDFEGAKFVCAPPLRAAGDREALWEAVANGEIDVIATDHCSYNFRLQKELGRGDFTKIPGGLPGIGQRAALIYGLGVAKGRMTPSQMARLLAENPAKLFGLYPRKGVLAVGSDADVVIWNPQTAYTLHASDISQSVDYTPYEGIELTGAPREVFLRGTLAAQNRRAIDGITGEYLKRGRSLLT